MCRRGRSALMIRHWLTSPRLVKVPGYARSIVSRLRVSEATLCFKSDV